MNPARRSRSRSLRLGSVPACLAMLLYALVGCGASKRSEMASDTDSTSADNRYAFCAQFQTRDACVEAGCAAPEAIHLVCVDPSAGVLEETYGIICSASNSFGGEESGSTFYDQDAPETGFAFVWDQIDEMPLQGYNVMKCTGVDDPPGSVCNCRPPSDDAGSTDSSG
jgi:hypothetical protein